MSTELRLLLRDLRQAQALSQDELARQLGISRQSIISLEQGAYMPSFPLLINIIHFFNCDLEELVEGLNQSVQQLPETNDGGANQTIQRQSPGSLAGAINIQETGTKYELRVVVPGFKEGDLNLEFSGDTLNISGNIETASNEIASALIRQEWENSSFSRSIRFAQPIKDDQVEAKLADGILTIHAPKVEPVKPKVKKIEVKK